MWSSNTWSSLAEAAKSTAAAAVQSAREGSSAVAETVKAAAQKIESDLNAEYARTQQAAASDAAGPSSMQSHVPPPRQNEKSENAFERITNGAVALLNPLDDNNRDQAEVQAARVVMLPWEQPGISEGTRTRMRSLSQERSIFLAPPAGGSASFRFDLTASLPLIIEALSVDPHLDEQRHKLVPAQVNEEQFFTNYFHHLHVLASTGGTSGACAGTSADGARRLISGRGGDAEADGGGGGGGGVSGGAALADAMDGGGGTAGWQSPRTETSASPVLVSAAVSEASDLAQPKDVGDPAETSGAMAGGGGSGGSGSSGGSSGGTAEGAGPFRRPPRGASDQLLRNMPPSEQALVAATKDEISIEEQFECVSNHLLQAAAQRDPTHSSRQDSSRQGANARREDSQGDAGQGAAQGGAAAVGGARHASTTTTATSASAANADALSSAWELELMAELDR